MSGVLSWREKQANEIKELKKQVEELKKENTELQRELSVHNFLDTGVPQERLDYQRELKKEIIRLKSLCRRAADEIRDLDDTIIKITKDFPEVREFLGWKDDDLWAGETSINLLNRLDGRTKGGYVENYEDLVSEMNAIDGE
jgi:DNA repair exonuclease SbcCD ATPase subunit